LETATSAELRDKLLEDFHIIYFVGHGDTKQGIYLKDADGYKDSVSVGVLAGMLEGKSTRLVFLNACNTDTTYPGADGLSSSFARILAVKTGLPAVIAMQYEVSDKEAKTLETQFFKSLAASYSVEQALAEARQALIHDGEAGRDAISPVMYLMADNGKLFRRAINWTKVAIGLAMVAFLALVVQTLLFKPDREKIITAQQTAQAEATARSAAQATAQTEANARIIAENAEQAQSVAISAQLVLEESPSLSLLLGVEALGRTSDQASSGNLAAERALHTALSRLGGYGLYEPRDETWMGTAAFSHDERWLVMGGCKNIQSSGVCPKGTAWVWDMFNPAKPPTLLSGHGGPVHAVAFSPDGRWIATGSAHGQVMLWMTTNLQSDPIIFETNISDVMSLAFSQNGKWLAAGGGLTVNREVINIDPGHAELWSMDNLDEEVIELPVDYAVMDLAFSPDGKWIATASEDGQTILWNIDNPYHDSLILKGPQAAVRSVAFSPNGQWLAAGGADNIVRLWNVEKLTNEPMTSTYRVASESADAGAWTFNINKLASQPITIDDHQSPIYSVAFNHIGYMLATGSADGTVKLYAMNNRENPLTLRNELNNNLIDEMSLPPDSRWLGTEDAIDMTVSPDGRWLVAANLSKSISLWDLDDPTEEPRILYGNEGIVNSMTFSPGGNWLITTSCDEFTEFGYCAKGSARLWNTNNWIGEPSTLRGVQNVKDLKISPDSHWLADNSGRLWEIQSPVYPHMEPRIVVTSPTHATAFSPDSKLFVTGGREILIWELADLNKEPINVLGHTDMIDAIKFSPDGNWLVASHRGGEIYLWETAKIESDPIILSKEVDAGSLLEFSVDSSWLATNHAEYDSEYDRDEGVLRLWKMEDLNSDPILLRGFKDDITKIEFSPGGQWMAAESFDGKVRIWNQNEFEAKPRVLGQHGSWPLGWENGGIAFSADEHWLAKGMASGEVWVWDMTDTLAKPIVLRGHTDRISDVAFRPHRDQLISSSQDHTVRLWDLDSNEAPIVFPKHLSDVSSVTFSPNGRWLATGTMGEYYSDSIREPSQIHVWPMEAKMLINLACCTAGRNLSQDEWRRYFPDEAYRTTCGDLQLPCADLILSPAVNEKNSILGVDNLLPKPKSLDGEKIIFFSDRNGTYDMYVMNPDGSEVIQLTDDPYYEFYPAWSPDRSQIAFVSYGEDNAEIYVLDLDNSELTNLTKHPAEDIKPEWSPDGSRIIFESDRESYWDGGVFIMNDDGSELSKIGHGGLSWPGNNWSPDGRSIAFSDGEINLTSVDGIDSVRLTQSYRMQSFTPVWSPDGQRIAFVAVPEENEEIYVMNADGTNAKQLTRSLGKCSSPNWSSDGTRVVFNSFLDNNLTLYSIDVESSDLITFTDRLSWSPDGKYAAFTFERDGNIEIYRMNTDKNDQVNLTNHPAKDFYPLWSP